jgi:hypothetical protein
VNSAWFIDTFFTAIKYLNQLTEGKFLSSPFTCPCAFAIVRYYLFRGHRNWRLQKWRGQTEGEFP